MRFTEACARLDTERRLYVQGIEPYDGQGADELLIRTVRRIEEEETRGWKAVRASTRATSRDSAG